jgi:hypothetical protein
MRDRSFELAPVDGDIDLLGVEGDHSGDRQELAGGEIVGPRQVGDVIIFG